MNESYEKAIEEYQEIEGDEEVMRRISPLMAECYIQFRIGIITRQGEVESLDRFLVIANHGM